MYDFVLGSVTLKKKNHETDSTSEQEIWDDLNLYSQILVIHSWHQNKLYFL